MNRAPADSEDEVLKIAERITKTPSDLTQLNKRVVHRQMEIWDYVRDRAGTELCALEYILNLCSNSLKIQDKGLLKL